MLKHDTYACQPRPRFDKRRSILIFAFNFFPQHGGIQTYSYELCRHLHQQGYTPLVLARKTPGDVEFDAETPYRIIRMKGVGTRGLRLIPMACYFLYAVLRHRVSLVHCVNWIPCGFVARLFHFPLRFKYLVTCHGGEVTKAARGFKRLFLTSTLKQADWIIAGNHHVRDVLAGLGNSHTPLSVIHFGVNHEVFRPDLDAEFLKVKYSTRRKKVLLTVAELKPRKGVDTVLRALKEMGDKAADILYLVVGDGPDKMRLETLTADLGLSSHVVFTGPVSERDLPFHYAICDLYVMVNRAEPDGDIEGFGITFIEAQSTEKAVVGGNSGGVPDAVVDGKTGVLAPPDNPAALAVILERLLNNPVERENLGKEGRKRALALFNWPVIANKTEMIYEKMFERKRRR